MHLGQDEGGTSTTPASQHSAPGPPALLLAPLVVGLRVLRSLGYSFHPPRQALVFLGTSGEGWQPAGYRVRSVLFGLTVATCKWILRSN